MRSAYIKGKGFPLAFNTQKYPFSFTPYVVPIHSTTRTLTVIHRFVVCCRDPTMHTIHFFTLTSRYVNAITLNIPKTLLAVDRHLVCQIETTHWTKRQLVHWYHPNARVATHIAIGTTLRHHTTQIFVQRTLVVTVQRVK